MTIAGGLDAHSEYSTFSSAAYRENWKDCTISSSWIRQSSNKRTALDKITLLWCLLPYTIGVEQCRGTLFVSYRYIGNQQCMVTKDLLYYYRGQTVYPYTVGPL